MSKPILFDDENDSDVDTNLKTDNEYAKTYDDWRKKEVLHKLQARYGEDALLELSDSSSSSDDDEDGRELTEEIEKDFFKTLSCLKNKDPKIYDENVKFFKDKRTDTDRKKKPKEESLYLKDYERKLLLEKGGKLSDDEGEDNQKSHSPTYVQEQEKLKESLKKALSGVDDNEDESWGGMFKAREKTAEEAAKEEAEYKEWLAGQRETLDDKEIESNLKPLKDYWNNPKLDEGEKFLKDYILNKRFLEKEDEDYIPTYDEIVHDSDEGLSEDEAEVEKQEEFEHKYNFRFEEPDQEFIKRYPRTIENSLRRTDDRRKQKRQETKERKEKEKKEKMEELSKLRDLKRKEIEEKIEKLKEITGNKDLAFKDEDLEGDFDPEAHDRKMRALFNDEFYTGPEEETKPEFSDIDEDLEIENWDNWQGETNNDDAAGPHCEDDDFIMDCDYDSQAATQSELIENSKGKKKRKRKSKFAKVVSQPKPTFDPNDKTYEEYLDEYYKLDCEDIIGDIPCRFKYRKVVPNDFGLSIEEILMAKDRELNKWCSLKKAVQIRPDHVEKYEQIAYEKKGRNLELKRRVLASLFEQGETSRGEDASQHQNTEKGKKMSEAHKEKSLPGTKKNKLDNKIEESSKDRETESEGTKTESEDTKTESEGMKIESEDTKTESEGMKIESEDTKTESEGTKTESEGMKTKSKDTSSKIETCTKAKLRSSKAGKRAKRTVGVKGIGEVSVEETTTEERISKAAGVEETITKDKTSVKAKEYNSSVQDSSCPSDKTRKEGKIRKNKNKKHVGANKEQTPATDASAIKKNKKRKHATNEMQNGPQKKKKKVEKTPDSGLTDARLSAYGINPKKFKNKLKYGHK